MIAGIIFPPSIIASALVVGAGGAAIGKLGNLNARNATARDLASVLTPGSSGIIALVKLAQIDQVSDDLIGAEEVKSAPVSDEAAEVVKEAAKAGGSRRHRLTASRESGGGADGAAARLQHSTTLRARPPRDVSLYLVAMSAPVSRIVLMAASSET